MNYRLPELSIGKFNVNWQTSYTSQYDVLADNAPATLWEGQVGTPGVFRVRSNLGAGWEKGDFSVNYMARYYSGMKETCAYGAASVQRSDPSTSTANLTVRTASARTRSTTCSSL